MSRQAEISDDKNQRMVGHIVQVLIEWVSMERDLLLKGGEGSDLVGEIVQQFYIDNNSALNIDYRVLH